MRAERSVSVQEERLCSATDGQALMQQYRASLLARVIDTRRGSELRPDAIYTL